VDRTTSTTIVIAVIVLAFAGMVIGWRGRRRRQSALGRPDAVPAETGRELATADAFYVATTIADEELNRVTVDGLGYRARATVIVTEAGVILSLVGEPDAFLPRAALRGVDRATHTIDRVVETGGLVRIAWTLGNPDSDPTDVDSYLRMTDPADATAIIAAVDALLPTTTQMEGDAL
jgi:hypothetical protein